MNVSPDTVGDVMEIIFERTRLYEEVWSEPLTKLGKKYGLSDNGLRKVCKALNIPLPRAGHWAKVAHTLTLAKPHNHRARQTLLHAISVGW